MKVRLARSVVDLSNRAILARLSSQTLISSISRQQFRTSAPHNAIKTQILGDVGEGITECMLNQWFVEEGGRVEAWNALCEMQSDKASVEIPSTFSGVVKKLYARTNDYVKTGGPLVDIDDGVPEEKVVESTSSTTAQEKQLTADVVGTHASADSVNEDDQPALEEPRETRNERMATDGPSLATPAIRGLLKQHKIEIGQVTGTGKDGRVLKDDIDRYVRGQSSKPSQSRQPLSTHISETAQPLSPIQQHMFQAMTKSLNIPHFLYTDQMNVTALSKLRRRLNVSTDSANIKFTLLPFIVKAISLSLNHFPLLNARLDTATDHSKPQIIYRSSHNIGIAMDTPAGLVVPVIKDVAALSITEIAHELRRLSDLGQAKKLSSTDLSGGTITVSNIGNIGGGVVSPIIVDGQLAILGIGRARNVPVFGEGELIEKAEMIDFSWSADHRVVDGATMARMGNMVKECLEEPERLLVQLR